MKNYEIKKTNGRFGEEEYMVIHGDEYAVTYNSIPKAEAQMIADLYNSLCEIMGILGDKSTPPITKQIRAVVDKMICPPEIQQEIEHYE